jgi:hypothetical protein
MQGAIFLTKGPTTASMLVEFGTVVGLQIEAGVATVAGILANEVSDGTSVIAMSFAAKVHSSDAETR